MDQVNKSQEENRGMEAAQTETAGSAPGTAVKTRRPPGPPKGYKKGPVPPEDRPKWLFLDRLRYEERLNQWEPALTAATADLGSNVLGKATKLAMERLGFKGKTEEKALYLERKLYEGKTKKQILAMKEHAATKEEYVKETFESAIRALPDKATWATEIDWIRSHPAMARKARMRNNTDPVLIDVDDIVCPPHGKAPSKGAVYALQHWANHPMEFFKQILGEQKKQSEDGGAAAVDQDMGLEEVARLLEQVKHD